MSLRFNPFTAQLDFDTITTAEETVITKITDENISALKLVTATSLTNIELSESDTFENSKVIGVSLSAAISGNSVNLIEYGQLDDVLFSFNLNTPLYLSSGGVITDTIPIIGFSVQIGHSLGAGSIFINIQEPIELF